METDATGSSIATPVLNIQVLVKGPLPDGTFQVSYNPPPGPNGYQFPKGTTAGIYNFNIVGNHHQFVGYGYVANQSALPAKVSPSQGNLPQPLTSLPLIYFFDSLQTGHLTLYFQHVSGARFSDDPQVGNDGQTGG